MFKALKKIIKQAVKTADLTAREYFAGFMVIDDCGTKKLCYTEKGAFAWVAFCGDICEIRETYDFKLLYKRVQTYN